MKATIDIADNLLERAKEAAHRRKITLRALVEESLDDTLRRDQTPRASKIKFITAGGVLSDEFRNATWEQIRDEIYRGRGT